MDTVRRVTNPCGYRVIVVDWGTTSLRCMLVEADGTISAETEAKSGIQFVRRKKFEFALMNVIGPWLVEYGALPVLALGMITSRNGWMEVPYVACPATVVELADGMIRATLSNGSDIYFLAGITYEARYPFPDVMRGEETQIVGFGLHGSQIIVLPGTHSKWAKINQGAISDFQTFITGEVFALFAQHSFIAKAATQEVLHDDWEALERGASAARSAAGQDMAFLTQLFSVRTGMLAGKLSPSQTLSYLSGLVIGNEFRQATEAGWFVPGDTIGIVGNDGLNDRYQRVAKVFDLDVKDGGTDAAVVGALEIFAASFRNAA